MVLGKGSTSFFYTWILVFPAPFVKKIVFYKLNGLVTLLENHLTVYVRIYFWAL